MRADWPFVGRQRELSAVESILNEGRRSGVVLVGIPGVGKSRLAAEGLALAERNGFAGLRATATKAARSIPFGAVATLLPPSTELPATDNRAEMIRRMCAMIVEQRAPQRVALLVDDAHLLDDATATLVHHLVSSGAAFVFLTVRVAEAVPDAVLSLWKDSLTERIPVKSLSVDEVTQVLAAALGGPVDRGMVGRLVAQTRGNIMFIRELVRGAVEDESIRNEGGLWRQVQPLSPSDRLSELVESRLNDLSPQQRSILELLAFGEPIGCRELDRLADPHLIEDLERRGLLVSNLSGHRLEMRLGHPLYADVLRPTTSAVRASVVRRSLAETVEGTGARRREDTLRVASWRLDSGGASPSLMLEAAHAARWTYDFELASRLARAAVAAGAGFEAKLFAVQVAVLQGRSDQAVDDLAELAREAVSDAQRGTVVLAQLDNMAFNLARIDEALRLADAAIDQITDPAWKDEIRAKQASLRLVQPAAGPRAAAAAAEPLLGRTSGSAKVWACFTASCSLTRLGRLQEALHWAEEGETEHVGLHEPLEGWPPWIHAYSRGEALVQLGRLEEAEALALEQYENGIANGSVECQAFFAWQLATRVAERGGVRSAIQRCREARGLYMQLGRPFFIRAALVHLALALALADEPDEATSTLAELDAMELAPELFAYSGDLFQARAWTAAAQGDLPRARAFLEDGLALAERNEDLVGRATALHGLARLGQSRQVARPLAALAAETEGALVAARAAHATALLLGDPDQLHASSAAFESMGARLLAAEAAADEAAALERAGDDRKAASAERRARALAAACEGAVTPSLRRLGSTHTLTDAERRVARCAGTGSSNKEIAEMFHVSIRTVEHQLQSAYSKLGVSGRKDLAAALAASDEARGPTPLTQGV